MTASTTVAQRTAVCPFAVVGAGFAGPRWAVCVLWHSVAVSKSSQTEDSMPQVQVQETVVEQENTSSRVTHTFETYPSSENKAHHFLNEKWNVLNREGN